MSPGGPAPSSFDGNGGPADTSPVGGPALRPENCGSVPCRRLRECCVETIEPSIETSGQRAEDERWLAQVCARRSPAAADIIHRAWLMARQAHAGQTRANGERYLGHPMEVAQILNSLNLDEETIAAAILHDVVEDTGLTIEDVRAGFGETVARLVDGVTKMDLIREYHKQGLDVEKGREQSRLEGLRKLLLAMVEDLRVVLIKLADRMHNMRTLKYLPEDKRRRIARETLDIYAPLANRLGIWQIKWELEDLSFRYLEPERYQEIARRLDERRADRERYITDAVNRLRSALTREGVEAEVSGRPKHIYSIWRKMQRKRLDFNEIFDVRAIRVLTRSIKDCYAALGVVHGLWPHIPKEFDDYITNPKGNDYQSLHTAVAGPGGRTLEVQIRTVEMHQHAELGVAAHWRYKEGGRQDPQFMNRVAWLRQLLEIRDEPGDAGDFLERFKTEVFIDRVYALTPRGNVIDLPRGATPLDFAYAVHSEVGHRCRGAKVNGAIVPLTYELKNGDQVEILTTRHGTPSRDWLNQNLGYLKTSRARGRVRQWFKQQDYDKNVAAGRDQLERELRRLGVSDVKLDKLAQRLRFAKVEELFLGLGRGELGPVQIAGAVQEELLPPPLPAVPRPRRTKPAGAGDDVIIEGVGNLLTHMAGCCKPAPPDAITGFITQGRGVTIHREDCPNVLRLAARDRSRVIDVSWGTSTDNTYPVDVQIEAYDRQGLLRDISLLLANEKVNVIGVNTGTDKETHIAHMQLTVEVPDVGKLSRVLARLGHLSNVIDVHRRK